MTSFVARIGGPQRPMRFRKSDGIVGHARTAEINADRLAGCSRPIREGDPGTLADYERSRAPRWERTPSVVVLDPITPVNLGDWIPPDLTSEVTGRLAILQQIPLRLSSTQEVHFLGIALSPRLGTILKNIPVVFLADLLRLDRIDLLKTKNLGEKGIEELTRVLRAVVSKVSEEHRLTLSDPGDWIQDEDLRTKVILHQAQLATIRLTQERPGTFRPWFWVFNPPGITIPVRLSNCILNRNDGRFGEEKPSPIIFLTDVLVLSTKDLLKIQNFGRKTLYDLRLVLTEIIRRLENGESIK